MHYFENHEGERRITGWGNGMKKDDKCYSYLANPYYLNDEDNVIYNSIYIFRAILVNSAFPMRRKFRISCDYSESISGDSFSKTFSFIYIYHVPKNALDAHSFKSSTIWSFQRKTRFFFTLLFFFLFLIKRPNWK